MWDGGVGAWAVRVALKEGEAPTQLGAFGSQEEAAREHDAIVLDLFGPGAATNFGPAHGAAWLHAPCHARTLRVTGPPF